MNEDSMGAGDIRAREGSNGYSCLFDIEGFHRPVLLFNRLPLPLLERLVDNYIEETKRRRLARVPRRPTGRRGGGG